MIIDDEADFASIGYKRSKNDEIELQVIMKTIDEIRDSLKDVSCLQVTATPYSLYLQPDKIAITTGIEVKPLRPKFTELVPIHSSYIGGEYYFEKADEIGSVPYYLFEPLEINELEILHHSDKRRFKLDDILTQNGIPMLKKAIVNFIVGGTIRRLQDAKNNAKPKKYSFIIHTETNRNAHSWQVQIVETLVTALMKEVELDSNRFKDLVRKSYDDLKLSVEASQYWMPTFEEVIKEVEENFQDTQTVKVNSEQDVNDLLDSNGQLELWNRFTIFIGGQILDRGLTIGNLIGFYYGRRATRSQQDTVLQHHRMYGTRPHDDLAVTRFYTSNAIYEIMRRIHEFDSGLRKVLVNNPKNASVVFIQKDSKNRIIPCSPNKIFNSNITTLSPGKRLLPIGFQTDYKSNIKREIDELDKIIQELTLGTPEGPIRVDAESIKNIVKRISNTFIKSRDTGYFWNIDTFISAIDYICTNVAIGNDKDKVVLFVRANRDISRVRKDGRIEDAPDGGGLGREVQDYTTTTCKLALLRQNGKEENGWKDSPFWWPILYMPQNMQPVVYSDEVFDYDDNLTT